MSQEHTRDIYLGAILGMAVGDAVGAPYEFLHYDEIEQKFAPRAEELKGGGRFNLEPGQWSRDTWEMLTCLESILTNQEVDETDICLRLLKRTDEEHLKTDQITRLVLKACSEDPDAWSSIPAEEWYLSAGSIYTNSCLPRVIPLALFYHNNLDELARATVRVCKVTHVDPRSVEACLAINFLLSQIIHDRFSKSLLDQCRRFLQALKSEEWYRESVLNIDFTRLQSGSAETLATRYISDKIAVQSALQSIPRLRESDLGTADNCVQTMKLAVWTLFHSDTYEEAICTAIRLGGDTDTQACVTGALVGARDGLHKIPTVWMKDIHDRGRLIHLAEYLQGAAFAR